MKHKLQAMGRLVGEYRYLSDYCDCKDYSQHRIAP